MEEDYKRSDLLLDAESSISIHSSSSSSWLDHQEELEEVSSSSWEGPLYELSDLMAQLPIKRGLSKFYDGKTQSYTSVTSVKSIDDLIKKQKHNNNNNKRRKLIKICNIGRSKKVFSPKPTISKNNNKHCPRSSSS